MLLQVVSGPELMCVCVPSVDVLGHTALKNNTKVAARRTATTATRTARKVVVNDNVVRAMIA